MELTNIDNISLSVAVWLGTDDYDKHPADNAISTTSLIKPVRAIVLARQHKDLQKVADVVTMTPSRMGTAYHDSIERSWKNPETRRKVLMSLGYPENVVDRIRINPTLEECKEDIIPVYLEVRGEKECEGFIVTGKFDFCLEGNLEDFKSTSVWAWIYDSNSADYALQGSIYRWLHPDIITGDHVTIQYIFTDWSRAKAKQDPSYPQKRIISKRYELKSIAETEAYVLLPLCTEEDLWQKPTVWKYYKNPDKLARATKNFDNAGDAYQRQADDGNQGIVKEVPGEVVRCQYCDVVGICEQAQQLILDGQLKL
jgi:hypothetical protein